MLDNKDFKPGDIVKIKKNYGFDKLEISFTIINIHPNGNLDIIRNDGSIFNDQLSNFFIIDYKTTRSKIINDILSNE